MKIQSYDLDIDYTPGKVNVVAHTLSRPVSHESELLSSSSCDICPVIVDLPRQKPEDLREAQLKDPDVSNIIADFEAQFDNPEASLRWTDRGYYLSQGILYRCDPDGESDEPQLVVPESLRAELMKELHESPTTGHWGLERTLQKIKQNYYFKNMRSYVAQYLKSCDLCQKYKSSNLKPAGLLQTPVPQQRFEVLAMDLFGPLPEGDGGEKWILLIEDVASRWVELFALCDATAESCARVLLEEVFLRYGFPRRIISDNGTQFVSAVMQKALFVLGRKNRELKTRLAILVGPEHRKWPAVLPIDMLACGTARPSKSPWSSPLHLAKKGENGWRPCGDYHALNARTIPDSYPVRHIGDFDQDLAVSLGRTCVLFTTWWQRSRINIKIYVIWNVYMVKVCTKRTLQCKYMFCKHGTRTSSVRTVPRVPAKADVTPEEKDRGPMLPGRRMPEIEKRDRIEGASSGRPLGADTDDEEADRLHRRNPSFWGLQVPLPNLDQNLVPGSSGDSVHTEFPPLRPKPGPQSQATPTSAAPAPALLQESELSSQCIEKDVIVKCKHLKEKLNKLIYEPERLTTVTYGMSCAPYLAIKALKQLAQDEQNNFPDYVIDALLNDFYVDDLLRAWPGQRRPLGVSGSTERNEPRNSTSHPGRGPNISFGPLPPLPLPGRRRACPGVVSYDARGTSGPQFSRRRL
ncbi:hypothetical protein K1T71_014780 [Dendrolimus kikuchii]|nr:hypothetical protein K1T71_014780 [Dendrolimus kikuchii]